MIQRLEDRCLLYGETVLFGDSLTIIHEFNDGETPDDLHEHPTEPVPSAEPNDETHSVPSSGHFIANTGVAGAYFAWQDQNPATADVVDLYYDFRSVGDFPNLITPAQQQAAETALAGWMIAADGRISFSQNTSAPVENIINIGVGDLAGLGFTSAPDGVLALGGGTVTHGFEQTVTEGIVWLDAAENWDTSYGNEDPLGTYDSFTVFAHEIGHALGLGHLDDMPGPDIMDGAYNGEKVAFSINDQAVIGVLYGSGTDVVPQITESTSDGGDILAADQVYLDDVIIAGGSACIGNDCANGENFSFDTVRLKENNLRIHFDDTSNSASFPNNDWRIIINDSTNGGASYFAIEDSTGGRRPFRIDAGAPNNSLFVEDSGQVGFGTNNPVVELHASTGDTPTLRLDQTGASGWTPQVWDVAGNETNFFIRDVTNGSKLPFRIRPGAPTNSLYVDATGNVGLGTASPSNSLHVRRNNSTAGVLIEEASATTATRQLLNLVNNGAVQMRFENTDSSTAWTVGPAVNNHYVISLDGSGGSELDISPNGTILINSGAVNNFNLDLNGNLTIAGTQSGPSSRALKENFAAIDVLARVAELDLFEWNYIFDTEEIRHFGPTAEDFYAAFGLGEDDKHISPSDIAGVAVAAAEELLGVIEYQDAQIARLAEIAGLGSLFGSVTSTANPVGRSHVSHFLADPPVDFVGPVRSTADPRHRIHFASHTAMTAASAVVAATSNSPDGYAVVPTGMIAVSPDGQVLGEEYVLVATPTHSHGTGTTTLATTTGSTPTRVLAPDVVINDDLIVDGSMCVGFDCVNGEIFGFDTFRAKENNLRLTFIDTSSTASFPRRDWQIRANDSANGGDSFFGIDDLGDNASNGSSVSSTPFRIEAGAPNHALYVDAQGDVGFGTNNPVVELHAVNGDTTTLRLEQNASSGWSPHTWDLAGNETNFFVRDVTEGSKLPFRIRPNAPTNSIMIDDDNGGEIGLGTVNPTAALHVNRTNGTAHVKIEEASGTTNDRNLLTLTNNGNVEMNFSNTSTGNSWTVGNESGIALGAVNDGIAVIDNAAGAGYIMYSSETVRSRVPTIIAGNSDHLAAVRFSGGQWEMNDNSVTWTQFTPRSTDRLLASVDFSANTITSLQGASGFVNGIAQGFVSGDLTFLADVFGGVANADEFTVNGTFFEVAPQTFSLGNVNDGIGVIDNATGPGFIMYSEATVQSRWPTILSNNSEHMIGVRYTGTQWEVSDNSLTWIAFTPLTTDRLIASVDFTAQTITGLQGFSGDVNGIQQGYTSGDLTFAANVFAGVANPGEYTVGGTSFTVSSTDRFVISVDSTDAPEFEVDRGGRVSLGAGNFVMSGSGAAAISGMLTTGSSRAIKENFEVIDPAYVLDQLDDFSALQWNYITDTADTPHVGPIAEEFYAAFGFGADNKHLAPGDLAGIAISAVQGLVDRIEIQQSQLAVLSQLLGLNPQAGALPHAGSATASAADDVATMATTNSASIVTNRFSAAAPAINGTGSSSYVLVPVNQSSNGAAAQEYMLVELPSDGSGRGSAASINGLALAALPPGIAADQVFNDDLIVDGSLCVGNDCVNGENFGFDTLRLKENNLRFHFDDTSTTSSFPRNDWRMVINDTSNGGQSYFGVEDATASRIPFRTVAGAPSDSIHVRSNGDVGFGTANPVTDVHSADGDTPTLRLEQNGSSGWTPQTWDIAGNETNFFIRDVTNGSKLPFRIRPNAATSSIDVAGDGDVGLGTSSPNAALHLRRTSATANFRIEEASPSTATRTLLTLANNGGAQMAFTNTDIAATWTQGVRGSDDSFEISSSVTGGSEVRIFSNGRVVMGPNGTVAVDITATGDLITAGAFTASSSEALKENFESLDSQEVLAQLDQLPLLEWNYIRDEADTRHFGPMAEDFYAAFGLGADAQHIAPNDMAGMALAGLQGVYELVQQNDALLASLLDLVNVEYASSLPVLDPDFVPFTPPTATTGGPGSPVETVTSLPSATNQGTTINPGTTLSALVMANETPGDPPSVEIDGGSILTIDEGGAVDIQLAVSDTAPGSFQVDVNWGDSTTTSLTLDPANGRGAGGLTSLSHTYFDDDPTVTSSDDYTITIDVTNTSTWGTAQVTTTATVNNVAPIITQLASTALSFNNTATVSGTIVDPGSDVFDITFNWGDGTPDTVLTGQTSKTFSEPHTFIGTDPFTVTVTVEDDDNGISAPATVTVSGVATFLKDVAVNGGTSATINEGQFVKLTGLIDSPFGGTYTAEIVWGDGQTETVSLPTDVFSITHTYVDDNPTGTSFDPYDITLTVTQVTSGAVNEATVGVTVNNVAPVIRNITATNLDSLGNTTLTGEFDDPGTADTFQVTVVDWGDGQTDTLNTSATDFSFTHTYADPTQTYQITVRVSDDDGGTTEQTTPVLPDAQAPVVLLSNVLVSAQDRTSIEEGQTVVLTGVVSETGTLEIDWDGDNVVDETVTGLPAGSFSITHVYPDDTSAAGIIVYQATLTFTADAGGETDSATREVTVSNVAPAITDLIANGVVVADADGSLATVIVNEGETVTLEGTFLDPGLLDVHTVVIFWGDGTSSTVPATLPDPGTGGSEGGGPAADNGERVFTATHVYLVTTDTTFTIQVDVSDENSGNDSIAANITVLDVNSPPSDPIDINADDNKVFEAPANGSTVGVTAQAIDPDVGDTVTYSLTDDAGGRFEIDPITGVVTVLDGSLLDGPAFHTITVTATDLLGETSTADFVIDVLNIPPTLGLSGTPVPVNEGSTFTLGVQSVNDPGDDTITQYTISWGDGTPDTVISATDLANQGNSLTHIYDDGPDAPLIQVGVVDEDGVHPFAGFLTVSPGGQNPGVLNVAPTAAFGNSGPVDEGGTASVSFSNQFDPSTADTTAGLRYSYDLDNNGAYDDGAGDGTYAGSLTTDSFAVPAGFLIDGPDTHTIGGRIIDKDEGFTDLTTLIIVNNVAPEVILGDVTMINENGVATLTGTIVDPGVLDTFTLDINWGDPLSPDNDQTFTFGSSATGSQTFTLTHQYLDDNPSVSTQDTYTINVSVTDDDSLTGSGTTHVLVKNVPPTLTVDPVTGTGTREDKATVDDLVMLSGSFTDPGTLDSHTVVIDWGEIDDSAADAADDQTVLAFGASDPQTFAETHQYATGGIFTITVTVIDDDSGQAVQQSVDEVWVSGVRLDPNTGELQVVGTDGDDKVDIKLGSDGGSDGGADVINVKVKLDQGSDGGSDGGVDFEADLVHSIRIVLCEGDDDASVHNHIDINASIFGDAGDDKLKGGGGDDLVDGGDGDDKLDGRGGSDTLLGGAGEDDLKGDGGSDGGDDVLSGGDGDDKLHGGQGRNVLIGGFGKDDIKGGNDGNVLVGGPTLHDDDPDALDQIRQVWSSTADYDDRVTTLSDAGGLLEAEVTVFADGEKDKLTGKNKAADLFYADAFDKLKGENGDTIIGVSGATASGPLAVFSFDANGDGRAEPLTDGIQFIHYLAGFVDETFTWGASQLDQHLDIDGDGTTGPLTDGLVIIRFLAGFTGESLTAGAVNSNGIRTDPASIESWLNRFVVTPFVDSTDESTETRTMLPSNGDESDHTLPLANGLTFVPDKEEDEFPVRVAEPRIISTVVDSEPAPSHSVTQDGSDFDRVFTDLARTGF